MMTEKPSNIGIKWLSCACFEIEVNGRAIVTDPYITANTFSPCSSEDVDKCDLFTLSHGHYDHITDFPVLTKRFPDAPILCGSLTAMPLVKWLDRNPSFVYPVESGLELDFGWVKVKALFGHHNDLGGSMSEIQRKLANAPECAEYPGMEELNAIGSLEYRNYIFTVPDNRRILIWGSMPTEDQFNMLSGIGADIAILQRNISNPEKLAVFAEATGAKTVIPHHMDLRKTAEEYLPFLEKSKSEFERRVPNGRFIIPEHGVKYEF